MNLEFAATLELIVRKFPKVEKVWGSEYWLVNEPEYCSKLLVLNAGYACSLHKHEVKKETFLVVEGEVELRLDENLGWNFWTMHVGDSQLILPGQFHRFASRVGGVILETSTFHSDADVVRLMESGPM